MRFCTAAHCRQGRGIMSKKIVIGLTGQTGAGKTTVSKFAEELGCYIVNADAVAKEALAPGSECLKRLADFFGSDIIDDSGCCRRKLLAKRAFSDKEKTAVLSGITHPWIISKSAEYIRDGLEKTDIVLFDAPQLYESGGDSLCDIVIAVTAPEEVRLQRIMNRDGIDRSAALLRINAQHNEDYYTSRADHVIDGSMERDSVRRKIGSVIGDLRKGDKRPEQ